MAEPGFRKPNGACITNNIKIAGSRQPKNILKKLVSRCKPRLIASRNIKNGASNIKMPSRKKGKNSIRLRISDGIGPMIPNINPSGNNDL